MPYIVKGIEKPEIDFAPGTVVEEVLQNVRTIVTTPRYSIPLDREFGFDASVIDRPIHVAKAQLTNEMFRQIRRYEPRAVVESIQFDADLNGRLSPVLEVSVRA